MERIEKNKRISEGLKMAHKLGLLNSEGENNPMVKYDENIISVIIDQRQSGIMEYAQLAELHNTTHEYMTALMLKKWKKMSRPDTGEKSKGSGPKSGTEAKFAPVIILGIINDKLAGLTIKAIAKKYGISTNPIKVYWRRYNNKDENIMSLINDYQSRVLDDGTYMVKYSGSKFIDRFEPREIIVENHFFQNLKCNYNIIRVKDGYYDFDHNTFLTYNKVC